MRRLLKTVGIYLCPWQQWMGLVSRCWKRRFLTSLNPNECNWVNDRDNAGAFGTKPDEVSASGTKTRSMHLRWGQTNHLTKVPLSKFNRQKLNHEESTLTTSTKTPPCDPVTDSCCYRHCSLALSLANRIWEVFETQQDESEIETPNRRKQNKKLRKSEKRREGFFF